MSADLSIIIKAVDQASGVINGVQGEIGGLEKGAGRLGGILKGGLMIGAGAAVAGIGALGAVLGSSVKAASEAEDIQAQLKAVLKSTGGVAGVTADAINEHALALSEVTRYEDDAIVAADNILLTFTNIGKDAFPKATEAVLDLSTAFGMDLQSAAMMVGKALNDPEQGLTALNRAGVQFTDSQKEMIKTMVETGDVAGAQDIIFGELNKQIGGSAEAAGKTFSGQLDIMKNALGNVGEEIGGALIPILTDMAIKFGPGLIEGAKKFADWAVTDLIPALQNVGKWLEENIPIAIAALKKAWLDAQPTVEFIKRIFGEIGEFLGKVWAWLGVNVPVAIALLKKAWLDAQPTIQKIKGVFEDIGTALGIVWDWMKEKIPAAVDAVKGAFDRAKDAIEGVIGKIREAIDKIREAIAAIREFLGLDSQAGKPGYGATPTQPAGGGGYGSTPTAPAGGGGYGATPGRGMTGGMVVNLTINAPGGNPQAVAAAAQTGMLAAARSMGLA